MGPAQAIRTCLTKSFQFSGRASRPEFWWFAPVPIIVVLATVALADVSSIFEQPAVLYPLLFVVFPALSLAMISAGARRLADTGSRLKWPFQAVMLTILIAYTICGNVLVALEHLHMYSTESLSGIGFITVFLGLPFALLALLVCAIPLSRPSQPNSNSYGPNPFEVTP